MFDDRLARKAVDKDANGLTAVAAGAGGHMSVLSPFALIQETRAWFDGPLALSGAMATGSAVAAAIAMGTELAFISMAKARGRRIEADICRQRRTRHRRYQPVHRRARQLPVPFDHGSGSRPRRFVDQRCVKMDFGSGGDQNAKAWNDIRVCGRGIGAVIEHGTTAALVDRLERELAEAAARIARFALAHVPRLTIAS